jgi:hypothetical protein
MHEWGAKCVLSMLMYTEDAAGKRPNEKNNSFSDRDYHPHAFAPWKEEGKGRRRGTQWRWS